MPGQLLFCVFFINVSATFNTALTLTPLYLPNIPATFNTMFTFTPPTAFTKCFSDGGNNTMFTVTPPKKCSTTTRCSLLPPNLVKTSNSPLSCACMGCVGCMACMGHVGGGTLNMAGTGAGAESPPSDTLFIAGVWRIRSLSTSGRSPVGVNEI